MRGYCGIGVYMSRIKINIGTLMRSAYGLGANFVFTIGEAYKPQKSDTCRSYRHLPMFEYTDWEMFRNCQPKDSKLVAIENTTFDLPRWELSQFTHFERSLFILGNEVNGLPYPILRDCHAIVHIETKTCLNVSVAGSIVLWDRILKSK